MVEIVGAFETETRRGWKIHLTTWKRERNGVNLTLTFTTSTGDTTEMKSSDKKDLHKTWLTVCLLTGTNSDLHDVLHSNWHTSLSSGAKFLGIERTVFEKGVTVVVLETYLWEKVLIEIECNLETVENRGKLALLNTKETAVLNDFVNWWPLIFPVP